MMNSNLQSFLDWLWWSSWQAVLLVCLIMLVKVIAGRRIEARWYGLLWLILPLRMIIPWGVPLGIGINELVPPPPQLALQQLLGKTSPVSDRPPGAPSSTPRSAKFDPLDLPMSTTTGSPVLPDQPPDLPTALGEAPSSLPLTSSPKPLTDPPRFAWSVLHLVVVLWLLGAVILAALVFRSGLRMWLEVKRRRPVVDQAVLTLLENCKEQMKVQTVLAIVETDTVRTPALFGFVRPRLLLPTGLIDSLSREELRHVFFHELAHLKRHDIPLGWVLALLQVAHWFNPFVWFGFARLRLDQELATDSLALSAMELHTPASYGHTIVNMLTRLGRPRGLPNLVGVLEDKSQLKRRIKMITFFKRDAYRWSWLACGVIIAVGCMTLSNRSNKSAQPFVSDTEMETRLARLDEAVAAKREALDIPGLALVVVKDDQVIYAKGHGVRNAAQQLPVTTDTVFPINQMTWGFTSALLLMAEEEGNLSLDDSPRDWLPYFSLKDPAANDAVTIRHLLNHTTGLADVDMSYWAGRLSREESIRLLGQAEPTAELGKAFQYQQTMMVVAGECAAGALGQPYEQLVQARIFDPLGMKKARATQSSMVNEPLAAVGYRKLSQTVGVQPVGSFSSDSYASSTGIIASADDLARWLRLLLNGGRLENVQLISPQKMAQWIPPHAVEDYRLGWMLRDRQGDLQLGHPGRGEGFLSMIGLLPGKRLGFALLVNRDDAPQIVDFVTTQVFALLDSTDQPDKPAYPAGAAEEAGLYGVLGGIKYEIRWRDGYLTMHSKGLPVQTLLPEADRKYRWSDPPEGFYVTFRPSKQNPKMSELVFERPYGTVVYRQLTPRLIAAATNRPLPAELMELVGSYQPADQSVDYRITPNEGTLSLIEPGKVPLALIHREGTPADTYGFVATREDIAIEMRRDAAGRIIGARYRFMDRTIELNKLEEQAPTITPADLEARAAKAHNADAIADLRSMVLHYRLQRPLDGMSGRMAEYRDQENRLCQERIYTAFKREVTRSRIVFDGNTSHQWNTRFPTGDLGELKNDALRQYALFNPFTGWRQHYETISDVRMTEVDGTPVHVVEKRRPSGVVVVEYFDQQTDLLLQQELRLSWNDNRPTLIYIEQYGDYQTVQGIRIPHRVRFRTYRVNPWERRLIDREEYQIEKVALNAAISDDLFGSPAWSER